MERQGQSYDINQIQSTSRTHNSQKLESIPDGRLKNTPKDIFSFYSPFSITSSVEHLNTISLAQVLNKDNLSLSLSFIKSQNLFAKNKRTSLFINS